MKLCPPTLHMKPWGRNQLKGGGGPNGPGFFFAVREGVPWTLPLQTDPWFGVRCLGGGLQKAVSVNKKVTDWFFWPEGFLPALSLKEDGVHSGLGLNKLRISRHERGGVPPFLRWMLPHPEGRDFPYFQQIGPHNLIFFYKCEHLTSPSKRVCSIQYLKTWLVFFLGAKTIIFGYFGYTWTVFVKKKVIAGFFFWPEGHPPPGSVRYCMVCSWHFNFNIQMYAKRHEHHGPRNVSDLVLSNQCHTKALLFDTLHIIDPLYSSFPL